MSKYLLFLLMVIPAPLVGISSLGEFLNAPLFLDVQIESPATNNNVSRSPVLKAGDMLKFQMFVPEAGNKQILGFNIEFALSGKDITTYLGQPSGTLWDGSPLTPSPGQPLISALLLATPTVPSNGYLGTVEFVAQQNLFEGDALIITSATMADSNRDNDNLDASKAAILFSDRVEPVGGDLDLDGDVDFVDFLTFAGNFGHQGPPPTPIPTEPAIITIRDTIIKTQFDTITIQLSDTLHVTIEDTVIVTIRDTLRDSLTITFYDTTNVVISTTIFDTVTTSTTTTTQPPEPTTSQADSADIAHEMILIPEGEFLMGSNSFYAKENEKPIHFVTLSHYLIGAFEVTNEQYFQFVRKTNRAIPRHITDSNLNQPKQPMVNVNWLAAHDYCAWVGLRLPTEAEWEKAAKNSEHKDFPWGDGHPSGWGKGPPPPEHLANVRNAQNPRTFDVGSLPAGISPYGLYDVVGNVWEWVQDSYDPGYYQNSPSTNPVNLNDTGTKVIKGGAYSSSALESRPTARKGIVSSRRGDLGFRCAKSVE